MTTEKYGLVARILHWLMAVMIIALFAVGLYMTGLADDDPARRSIYGMHKAMGTLALILAFFRIAWIFISPPPAPPSELAASDVKIQKAVIGILYLLMIMVPLSGFLMSTFSGYPVSFFGLFEFPLLFDKSKDMAGLFHEIHEYIGFVIIAVVVLHILGALKHRLKDKNGPTDVLNRML